jgi:predicted phosphodiesterase
VALAVLIAGGGMLAGWRLAGPTETETELGRVSFNVAADLGGGVDAFVPIADWGLRANSFDGPFRLEVEVRAVDRPGAIEVAGGDRAALQGLVTELESAARDSVIRGFVWALAAVLLLAGLVWLAARRSPWLRPVAPIAAGLGVLATGASIALAAATFDSDEFSSPSFYGRGEELAQLLDFFERQQGNDRYSSTFDQALGNFSAYLSNTPRFGEGQGTKVLVGSDLHNNAAVLPALAEFGDGDPVILAGDFAVYGDESEARLIAPGIAALSRDVIAVSGNHDSHGLMRALARDGVTVLEQEGVLTGDGGHRGGPVAEVAGLELAGFADPLEWEGPDPTTADRVFSFPELENGDELQAEAEAELVDWFESLPRAPEIVLVHQNVLAQHLAGHLRETGYSERLTIVTGHNHYQQISRYGEEITVVNAGTLGAGGVLRLGQEFVGLGQLNLQGEQRILRSVDLIRIEPLSGQAEAERVILDQVCPPEEADELEPCVYEP